MQIARIRYNQRTDYYGAQEGGEPVRNIVIDMQSALTARGYERMLLQDMRDCNPIISDSPEFTVEQCRLFRPYALLMEVTGYTPWMLNERLRIWEKVKKQLPDCKCMLAVDENADAELAGQVANCKKEGRIDAFIFTSVSDKFLAAVLETL